MPRLLILFVFALIITPTPLHGQNKQDVESEYYRLKMEYNQANTLYMAQPNPENRANKDRIKADLKALYDNNKDALAHIVNASEIDASKTMALIGPDAHGYLAKDDAEADGPAANQYQDISGLPGVQTFFLSDDEGTGLLPMVPPFNFYGTVYNGIYISSNGYLSFDDANLGDWFPAPIPTGSTPNSMIAPFWGDLHPYGHPVYWGYFPPGTCPVTDMGQTECHIGQHDDISYYGGAALGDFQTILYPNGNILTQYGLGGDFGGGHVTGIENENGTDGLQYTGVIVGGRAIRFEYPVGPQAPYFTSVPPSGPAITGNTYNYPVTAIDFNGDPITFSAPTLPSWLTLTPTGPGAATLAGTPGPPNIGDNPVVLQVDDGITGNSQQAFSIAVIPSNYSNTLFGTAHNTTAGLSTLYTIDATTGAATEVGPTGFEHVTGLAFDPATRRMYGAGERPGGATDVLLDINTLTGRGTEIGPIPPHSFGGTIADIALNSNGELFAYLEGGDGFGEIDPLTGALTEIGPTGFGASGNGMDFNGADVLYQADGLMISTIDPLTGAGTPGPLLDFQPPADNFPRMNGLAFDPDSGTLFGALNDGFPGAQENHLSVINPLTGQVDIIGPTIDGLAALTFGSADVLGDTDGDTGVERQDAIDLIWDISEGAPYRTHLDVDFDGDNDFMDAVSIFIYAIFGWDCWPGPGCQNQYPWATKTGGGAEFAWSLIQTDETDGSFRLPIQLVDGSSTAFAVNITYNPDEISILGVETTLPDGWEKLDHNEAGQFTLLLVGSSFLQVGDLATVKLSLIDGTNSARIEANVITGDGIVSTLGSMDIVEVPGEFALEQNYPNPFNPTTQIQYALPTASDVELIIYDQIGHEVRRLVSARQEAGRYTVTFDASDLASGLYIYRLRTATFEATKQMILVK